MSFSTNNTTIPKDSNRTESNKEGIIMMKSRQQQITEMALCTLAFILNLTVLVLIIRKRRRKQATTVIRIFTHYFLIGTTFSVAFMVFENIDHKTKLEGQIFTNLCWLISHLTYNNLAFISLQRFLAVYKPLKCKYWITNKVTMRFISANYLVTCTYYTICSTLVMTYDGLDWTFSFVNTTVFVVEISFSLCPYILIFIKLCNRKKSIGDSLDARRTKNLVKSCVFCCLLLAASLISVVPIVAYNYGEKGVLKDALLLVWTEPIFSATWYLFLMLDWKSCHRTSSARQVESNNNTCLTIDARNVEKIAQVKETCS